MPAASPIEFRRRAVELAREGSKPVARVARDLGISESGLRRWMSQAEVDEGKTGGPIDCRAPGAGPVAPGEPGAADRERDPETGGGIFSPRRTSSQMIFTFIAGSCSDLPVRACCRAMGVSSLSLSW